MFRSEYKMALLPRCLEVWDLRAGVVKGKRDWLHIVVWRGKVLTLSNYMEPLAVDIPLKVQGDNTAHI